MFAKKITYTDFNGSERTETFYFNFTKAELAEMELGRAGGFTEYVDKIVSAQDSVELIKLFKELVLKAYGEKSEDGRRFMKSDAIREAFSQTQAYSDIFMEFAFDEKAAAKFINAVVPADISSSAIDS